MCVYIYTWQLCPISLFTETHHSSSHYASGLFHNIGFLPFHHLKLHISPSMVGIHTEQMIYPNTHHRYDYIYALIFIHLKEKSWYLCLHSEYWNIHFNVSRFPFYHIVTLLNNKIKDFTAKTCRQGLTSSSTKGLSRATSCYCELFMESEADC